MPFPRRNAVTKAPEKKRQVCKKLQTKHLELKKKYNTNRASRKYKSKSSSRSMSIRLMKKIPTHKKIQSEHRHKPPTYNIYLSMYGKKATRN
ncbi:hypothetical protein DPMN_122215 [Dreissena polymorpha]|uniref:Uncharacterized protein n=1 Tax=Dreissena polymorpha TaxID=45954 RepID=A0A9D4GS04_DREPO|nr:hypothetical protein DPMN_122215 [Dreissena polymorpha]